MGSKLSILTVGEDVTEEARQFARIEGSVALEGLSSQLSHQAKEIAQKAGVAMIDVRSACGDPAEAIIETARREKGGHDRGRPAWSLEVGGATGSIHRGCIP